MHTHTPPQSSSLFHLFHLFDPLPFVLCVSIAGKRLVITGIVAHSPLPDRIEFWLTGPSCEHLFTHRRERRRRLMPSGLAEKQTPRTPIKEMLLLPPFPSDSMWRPNSSVKHRGYFLSSDYSLGKPWLLFFLCASFSHC